MCLALLVPFSGVGLVSCKPQRGRPSWPSLAGAAESLAVSWGLCGSGFLTPGTSDPGFQDAWDSLPIRVCCPQAAGQEVAGVWAQETGGHLPSLLLLVALERRHGSLGESPGASGIFGSPRGISAPPFLQVYAPVPGAPSHHVFL